MYTVAVKAPDSSKLEGTVRITGSKSESNRLLLLRAHYPGLRLENLSNSEDTQVMRAGLGTLKGEVDIHHAGTAMRFLTAFYASAPDAEVVLTGSPRMQERPVEILVKALRALGAEIEYVGNEGYPPLRIRGRQLEGGKVALPANVSSQYISALLLIAPRLALGLTLELEGTITSVPYIKMTLELLNTLGVHTEFEGQQIRVEPFDGEASLDIMVESDWSSASYFYSLLALAAPGSEIRLQSYFKDSRQGDSRLLSIFREFGVDSSFDQHTLTLHRASRKPPAKVVYDLADAPDIAQTIAVCCLGLGIGCELTGLHTLKIKETDRLEALYTELSKLGARVEVTEDSLRLEAGSTLHQGVSIATYNDHRMAMAFAPLALKTPMIIEDAEVVGKSYPDFWTDLDYLGFHIKQL